MNRRQFLFAAGSGAVAMNASAASGANSATFLFQDQIVALEKIRPDTKGLTADGPHANGLYTKDLYTKDLYTKDLYTKDLYAKDLWVRAVDLPRINQFTVKPQGACRGDMCVPISKTLKSGEWFNLTGFAQKLHQSYVAEESVWSFGEIPVIRGDYYQSRIAPEFAVPDRHGRLVRLSDFRGKKVLVVTWASW